MALLVLLFMLCLSVSAENRTWHTFNGFQYSIEINPVNSYAEAEMGCSALQANVANVKTTTIFEFLKSCINLTDYPYSFNIGARRVGNTNIFQWNDGSNVSVSTMWQRGQPSNPQETCVTMGHKDYSVQDTSYRWYDVPCTTHSARYICEKIIRATAKVPSSKPTTLVLSTSSTANFDAKIPSTENTTPASEKVNTAIIASTIGGCVILVIICIVIVFVKSCNKKKRNTSSNEAAVIYNNAGDDGFKPEETYNIPQVEENNLADHSTQPQSRHLNDDVNHYDATQESHQKTVAQPVAGSSDVYAQVTKSKQSTKVNDNGQQSHVRKCDHNQSDDVSYDTLQLSQHVEVHDQFASGINPTNIYDNRHGANDESDSPYDELRRDK